MGDRSRKPTEGRGSTDSGSVLLLLHHPMDLFASEFPKLHDSGPGPKLGRYDLLSEIPALHFDHQPAAVDTVRTAEIGVRHEMGPGLLERVKRSDAPLASAVMVHFDHVGGQDAPPLGCSLSDWALETAF